MWVWVNFTLKTMSTCASPRVLHVVLYVRCYDRNDDLKYEFCYEKTHVYPDPAITPVHAGM